MCFFYALSQDARSLKNRYQLKFEFEFEFQLDGTDEPKYYASGFDYPRMPVITADHPEKLQYFDWGLIPSWVKTPVEALEIRSYTLNARSDTVFTKPSFRNAIRQRRCLVPAEGFYEWRLFQGRKYPYYIHLQDKTVFSFAGIWEEWVNRSNGEVRRTYSILTTEANSLMEKIHNTKKRMPVILPVAAEREWLRNDLSQPEILELTRPLDAGLLETHTISKLITSRTENRNVPAIQERYDYPELAVLG
ncbi:MAG TPA: SOS response-associated peptidase [Bacillota bacterium]|nr:SOS response-associated peptidase [Bacillota bacterium]